MPSKDAQTVARRLRAASLAAFGGMAVLLRTGQTRRLEPTAHVQTHSPALMPHSSHGLSTRSRA
eukprot:6840768-Lingulodinium_polyedra.AAC.1